MTTSLIEFSHVYFSYSPKKTVFTDFNFKYDGGRLGITGENGCGKTTFFSLLMGLIKPDQGQIRLKGQLCQQESDFQMLRRSVGYVFQDADNQLFCPSVKEDIAFGCYNLGMKKNQIQQAVQEIAEQLNIAHLLDESPFNLSGGEKKRVSIATVLVMKPEIILLDEPSAHLDTQSVERICDIIKKLPNVIIVSHETDFLKRTVESISLMEDTTFPSPCLSD